MDDPSNISDSSSSELQPKRANTPMDELSGELIAAPPNATPTASGAASSAASPSPIAPTVHLLSAEMPAAKFDDSPESRRRKFLHNLYLLLPLTLVAFTLTIWILVRVESPFGIFSSGPQEIVRAQLLALDRGEFRHAYDMFSERYRGQVSFNDWHELIVTHWRMFHAEVESSEVSSSAGPGIALELFLHGQDDKDYRARFTLIHRGGRWWIDDMHWTMEPDQRDVSRT
jgi:hypothetical protein